MRNSLKPLLQHLFFVQIVFPLHSMFPRLSINRLGSGLFLKEIFLQYNIYDTVFIFLHTSVNAPDQYKFCPHFKSHKTRSTS